VTQHFLLAMSSFEEVLEQLAEIHDREVARLAQRCSDLQGQLGDDVFVEMMEEDGAVPARPRRSGFTDICCLQPVFTRPRQRPSAPSRRERKVIAESVMGDIESGQSEAEEGRTVGLEMTDKVFTCHFSREVEQLGFRIRWNATASPSVQMLEPNSAAQQRGVREDDIILEVNGIETAGKDRAVLLPSLKERPLELKLSRPKVDIKVLFQESQTFDSLDEVEVSPRDSLDSKAAGTTNIDRLGLKKYVEQQDKAETVVSKTVRQLLEKTSPNDGTFERFRTSVANFAVWWDGLVEPPREGRIYDFVESRSFKLFSAFVIVVNAMVVTWLTDWSLSNDGKNMPPGFEFVDLGFLLFYLLEVVLRIWVSKGFFFVNDSAAWNTFDLLLVVFSTMDCTFNWPADGNETPPNNLGYMRVFRMFKFAKILRTIRIISFVRELSMMLESFRKCIVAMFWGLVLLMFLLYVFALIFAQGVASHIAAEENYVYTQEVRQEMMDYFGSVGNSMLSLYLSVTGGNDWSVYYVVMTRIGSFYPAVFLSYTFFFIFALFNILTGVFVERAVAASLPDREELISEERKKLFQQVEDLRNLFKALDTDGSGKITKAEFINDMKDDRIVSYMNMIGLEMHDAEHFFDIIADDCEEVDIDAFIEHSMAMRGNATALDMRRQLIQTGKMAERLRVWDQERWPWLQKALRRAVQSRGNEAVDIAASICPTAGLGQSRGFASSGLPGRSQSMNVG